MIPSAILVVLSGERTTLGGGFVIGFVLVVSGILPSLRLSDPVPPSASSKLIGQAMAALSSLTLLGSVLTSLLVGKPWSNDPSVRERFGRAMLSQALGKGGSTPGQSASGTTDAAAPEADLSPVSHSLPGIGVGLSLPKLLGDPQPREKARSRPYAGDLTGKLQQLDVAVRRHEAPFKRSAGAGRVRSGAGAGESRQTAWIKAGRLTLLGSLGAFDRDHARHRAELFRCRKVSKPRRRCS